MQNTVLSQKSVADIKKELHECYAHRRDSQRKIIELAAQIRRSNQNENRNGESSTTSLLRPRKAEEDSLAQKAQERVRTALIGRKQEIRMRDDLHAPLLSFPDQTGSPEKEEQKKEQVKGEGDGASNVISLKAKKLDKSSRMKSFEVEKVEEKERKRDIMKPMGLLGSTMFRGLQAHLKRASTNLAKEKSHLEKQKEVVRKIDEDLKKENLQLKEQKVEQLQKKKEEEIKLKRKLDKRVKSVSNQLTTEMIVSHQKKLASFIRTKYVLRIISRAEPSVLWRPAHFNTRLEEARKENEAQVKTKITEFKEIMNKALEAELKAYDSKIEEIEARRLKRQQERAKQAVEEESEEQVEEEEEEEDVVVASLSEGEEKEIKKDE